MPLSAVVPVVAFQPPPSDRSSKPRLGAKFWDAALTRCPARLFLPPSFPILSSYSTLSLQVLSKLQAQLQQGPLPGTTGTELMAKGGSFGNGGRLAFPTLSKPRVFASCVPYM
jgi:hypothetical protein